jgi:Bacterial conjugation TrbI-like protein
MPKKLQLAMLTTALTAASVAQSVPASSSTPPDKTAETSAAPIESSSANQLPAGSIIPVELSKSVDSKKAKPGDKVEAKTSMDLLSHGKVAIPRNTKIIGHVTEAKAHSKESPDSRVGIAFDRISMKDGREMPIQAAVQAIARPLQSAALSSGALRAGGAETPSGTTPTTAGGDMGATMPPRSSERVPSIPSPISSGTGTPQQDDSTVAPLGPTSQGVVGMKGLSLKTSPQGATISSEKDNVHLDGGTQIILRTQ